MCNNNTLLHQTDLGYAVHCGGCNSIQVVFGNFSIKLSRIDFSSLKKAVEFQLEAKKNLEDPYHRCIYLSGWKNSIHLVFSLKELENFDSLLQQAAIAIDIKELLDH
jgi:hypothetical protein